MPRTLSASRPARADVGLLRGLGGVPIEQMQHEPGCQCGSEPSAEPAARDVDDIWQPALAIAGSVRRAQQPQLSEALLMPEVGLRLTFSALCADPSWSGRRATSRRGRKRKSESGLYSRTTRIDGTVEPHSERYIRRCCLRGRETRVPRTRWSGASETI